MNSRALDSFASMFVKMAGPPLLQQAMDLPGKGAKALLGKGLRYGVVGAAIGLPLYAGYKAMTSPTKEELELQRRRAHRQQYLRMAPPTYS